MLVCGLFLHNVVLGQREGDSFAIGYCHYMFAHGCVEPYGSSIYKFNEEGIEEIIEPAGLNLNTDYSRAAFSDNTTGDLIFASNGWRLVNRSGEVISYKLWRDDLEAPNTANDTANPLYTQNPLFLPDPGDSTKAYLFYGQYQLDNLFGTGLRMLDVLFTYAYLDIPTQSLINKGNVLITDTTGIGGLAAVKHANGRDWWVVKPGRFQDEYYVGLLTPQGIQFEKQVLTDVEHLEQGRPCSYFSEAGDVFVNFTGSPFKIYRFNFDRCEGSFSNVELHSVADSVWNGDWMAPALSADASKFYFRRSSFPFGSQGTGGLFQFDFETEEINRIIINGTFQLTPNFKQIIFGDRILINDTMYQTYGTIDNLDAPFSELIIHEHVDTVLNVANFLSPFAVVNFRLGKIEGSLCDTVISGTARISEKQPEIHLYPNPVRDVLYVEFPDPNGKPYQVVIFDLMGRIMYSGKHSGEENQVPLLSPNILPGLYLLQARQIGGDKVYSKRFVVAER